MCQYWIKTLRGAAQLAPAVKTLLALRQSRILMLSVFINSLASVYSLMRLITDCALEAGRRPDKNCPHSLYQLFASTTPPGPPHDILNTVCGRR